jgi:hypothetical protein
VRAVIHFFDLLDTPDEDFLARIEDTYGEGIVNLETVQRWTSKFRNGKTNLDNEQRPGDPDKTKTTGNKNHD